MRILILVKNFDLGGTEVHVRDLANGLVERGHRVFLMARKGRQIDNLNSEVTFIECRFSDIGILPTVLKINRLVRDEKIDLIHGHQRLPILIASLARMLFGTASVATIHGRIKLDARPAFLRRWLNRIIVVAPNRLDALGPKEPIRRKCSVVYNGMRFAQEQPSPKPSCLNLLYASRIDRRHGQALVQILKDVWPALIKEYPDMRLHIAGDGAKLPEVKEAAQALPSGSNETVIFHGFVPSLAPIFEETSLTLGVGRVAIESLANGIPVIPVNSAQFAPVVSEENYELLKSDNFVGRPFYKFEAEKLRQEILRVLENHRTVRNETLRLMKTVREDFSMSRMIDRTENVYREALEVR